MVDQVFQDGTFEKVCADVDIILFMLGLFKFSIIFVFLHVHIP